MTRPLDGPLPVYVIHWNAPKWCSETVASLRTSELPVSITVIDNGGAPLDIRDTRVLRQPTNSGYTGGANAALADWLPGEAPFAVITSHDVDIERDTLVHLLEAMESDPHLGICGPAYGDKGSSGGRLISVVADIEEREWVSGTCLLMRRECALAVGRFDEDFASYVEDVDYCNRARARGWKVATAVTARAAGRGSGSGRLSALRMIRANGILLRFKEAGWSGATREALGTARFGVASLRHRRFAQSRACWEAIVIGYLKCVRRQRASAAR